MKIIRRRELLRYCATLFLISKHIKFGDNKSCFLSFVILFFIYICRRKQYYIRHETSQ